MAHQLRIHTVLAEDICSGPSTHVGHLTTACNSSFRGSEALFWLFWVPESSVYIHTDTYNSNIKQIWKQTPVHYYQNYHIKCNLDPNHISDSYYISRGKHSIFLSLSFYLYSLNPNYVSHMVAIINRKLWSQLVFMKNVLDRSYKYRVHNLQCNEVSTMAKIDQTRSLCSFSLPCFCLLKLDTFSYRDSTTHSLLTMLSSH